MKMGFPLCSLAFPSPDHTPKRNHTKKKEYWVPLFTVHGGWAADGAEHLPVWQPGWKEQTDAWPLTLSFSLPLHPGPQPIRGTTTSHGSPPLKGSSREGSHRCTQKPVSHLLGASQPQQTDNQHNLHLEKKSSQKPKETFEPIHHLILENPP